MHHFRAEMNPESGDAMMSVDVSSTRMLRCFGMTTIPAGVSAEHGCGEPRQTAEVSKLRLHLREDQCQRQFVVECACSPRSGRIRALDIADVNGQLLQLQHITVKASLTVSGEVVDERRISLCIPDAQDCASAAPPTQGPTPPAPSRKRTLSEGGCPRCPCDACAANAKHRREVIAASDTLSFADSARGGNDVLVPVSPSWHLQAATYKLQRSGDEESASGAGLHALDRPAGSST